MLASYTSSFNYWRRNFPIKSHICLLLSRSLVIFLKKEVSYTSTLCFLLGSIHMWALWESSQVEAVSGHTHQNVPQGKQSYLSVHPSIYLLIYVSIAFYLYLFLSLSIYLSNQYLSNLPINLSTYYFFYPAIVIFNKIGTLYAYLGESFIYDKCTFSLSNGASPPAFHAFYTWIKAIYIISSFLL